MITADEMKKLAFEKKKGLDEERLQKHIKKIERINALILENSEIGKTCIEFNSDSMNETYQDIALDLSYAIQENNYIYQSFIERGFQIETKPKHSSYSIIISWD